MSYYAEIDDDRRVLRVVVCDDPQWLTDRLGGTWVETTDVDPLQQYAGPGMHDGETVAPMRFVPPWAQPTHAGDAYPVGQWVWHGGRCWRNLTPANTHAPGVSGWRENVVEWPAFVPPSGAHDAYQIGEKITEAGKRYICKVNATTFPPSALPASWTLVGAGGGGAPVATVPAWKPWDGHNASLYQVGAKVTHKGREWTATAGNNHWEPGVYGWV